MTYCSPTMDPLFERDRRRPPLHVRRDGPGTGQVDFRYVTGQLLLIDGGFGIALQTRLPSRNRFLTADTGSTASRVRPDCILLETSARRGERLT